MLQNWCCAQTACRVVASISTMKRKRKKKHFGSFTHYYICVKDIFWWTFPTAKWRVIIYYYITILYVDLYHLFSIQCSITLCTWSNSFIHCYVDYSHNKFLQQILATICKHILQTIIFDCEKYVKNTYYWKGLLKDIIPILKAI